MKLTLQSRCQAQFLIVSDRASRVVLQPLEHERGRFRAISDTRFFCPNCRTSFSRSEKVQARLGNECAHCGADAERVEYLVNVLEPHGNPVCSCESYTTKRGAELCKHGHAALYLFGKLEAAAAAEKHEGQ